MILFFLLEVNFYLLLFILLSLIIFGLSKLNLKKFSKWSQTIVT